jgi:hypothetical protein
MNYKREANLSPMAKLVLYCASCRATSTFVWMEAINQWACIGNPSSRREGCGKHLSPSPIGVTQLLPDYAQSLCRAPFVLGRY